MAEGLGSGVLYRSLIPQDPSESDDLQMTFTTPILSWTIFFVAGSLGPQDEPRYGRFDHQVDGERGSIAIEIDAEGRLVRVTRDGRLVGGDAAMPLALSTLSSPVRDVDIDGPVWLVGADDGLGLAREGDGGTWWVDLPEVRGVSLRGPVAMAITNDGTLASIDAATGDVRWRRPRAFPGARAVQVLDDGGAWIGDTDRHQIVRIDSAGDVQRRIGDRGAFPGLFNTPTDLELVGDRLLVADRLNHRISVHRVEDGAFLDQWGMHAVVPREGEGKIHYPEAVVANADGSSVYVLEPFERRYQVFGTVGPGESPAGATLPEKRGVESHFGTDIARDDRFLVMWEPESASVVVFELSFGIPVHVTTFGHGGPAPVGIGRLTSIAVDGVAGDVWLLDAGHRRLSRWALRPEREDPGMFDPFMGRFARGWSWASLDRQAVARGGADEVEPVDVLAGDGQVFILDRSGPSILVADRTLDVKRVVRLPERVDPSGFAIAEDGGWWVLDASRAALLKFDAAGVVEREIDLAGLGIEDPGGVVESDGLVVVSDRVTDRWVSLDAAGRRIAAGGETGAWDGALWRPAGLTTLPDGSIAVVDQGNHRAQGFDPRTGDWTVTFSLGQGHDTPRLLREDFEPAEASQETAP